VLMILNVVLATVKHALPMVPDVVFVVAEALLLIIRAVMAVLFGHAIHALREEYGDSMITLKEARELKAQFGELSSELIRVQEQLYQHIERQASTLNARQVTILNAIRQEVETTVSSLTPDCLIASLTGHIETMLQERLNVSLEAMRQSSVSLVSSETSNIRLLPSHAVSSKEKTRQEMSGETTHLARVYALLDENPDRKPADIIRLTGISKATVYRLVERYHQEHPVIDLRQTSETAS